MWNFNLTVNSVFAYSGSLNAQANLSGLGWRIIAPNSTDGVTNVHVLLTAAAANGRNVHAFIDASGMIVSAQLA
jgi:hypothetical protein